ncbi:unnamed protein product [Bursaphelenchus okinawaensis]|uniref:AB hydrolase-1 domain-containing protein n=1 Tax=Bursaphelenchus okinawaensis TaxID=465554 RepID=A0A811L9L5_9BILA|nr:unnamed protein product [Bursaphelenchus okinawaensis]CAG9120311.1 unnamed protein product [Bursaphelenchus okinawaensis]
MIDSSLVAETAADQVAEQKTGHVEKPTVTEAPEFVEVTDSFLSFLKVTKAITDRLWLVLAFLILLVVIFAVTQRSDRPQAMWLSRLVLLFLAFIVIAALSVPLILLNPRNTRYIIFQNFVRKPPEHFEDAAKFGVKSLTKNFYISSPCPHVSPAPVLGMWHVLPHELSEKYKKSNSNDDIFDWSNDEYPIVVYFHGTNEHRAKQHRCMMYNFLSKLNYHVIVGDYRGYGDSTGIATEKGVIRDAVNMYLFVVEHTQQNQKRKIIVWGHSLGTGISCMFVNQLNSLNLKPYCLVLESPFSALHDVFISRNVMKAFLWIPYFREYVAFCFECAEISMETHKHITDIKCPILMLHADDDPIVPIRFGRKLYDHVKHGPNLVDIVTFEAKLKLKHNHMYRAPHLSQVIRDFFAKVDKQHV